MSWALIISLILGFGVIFLCSWPLLISCDLFPFLLRVSWPGLAFEYDEKPHLRLLGYRITLQGAKKKSKKPLVEKAEKSSKKTKTKKKKKKKSFKKFNLQLIKEIWGKETIQIILKKCIKLLAKLVKSFKFKGVKGDIGSLDYYQTGVLSGLLYAAPEFKKIDLKTNFVGEQSLSVSLSLSLGKVLFALLTFVITFPFLRTWKLYNFLLQPNNAAKTK
ncbi:MAG: hypothetical protein QNL04_05300 [SAR324 cluster bacterium]|nr:hypothetical protein [SAR324 cluster bacterium]